MAVCCICELISSILRPRNCIFGSIYTLGSFIGDGLNLGLSTIFFWVRLNLPGLLEAALLLSKLLISRRVLLRLFPFSVSLFMNWACLLIICALLMSWQFSLCIYWA